MRIMVLLFVLMLVFSVAFAQEETPEITESPQDRLLVMPERPAPFQSVMVDGVTLEVLFEQLPQGRAGLLHLHGEAISEARLRLFEDVIDFFPAEDGFYGFIVAGMDRSPRTYDFTVFARLQDGTEVAIPGQIEVVLGGFVRQDGLTVPPDRAYLLEPQIERNEFAQLFSVFENYTPERLWDGFQFPLNPDLTSPFGAYRTFNQTVPARHTGWDLRAPTGTPVMAMAAGRVAFAGLMDIRGNHIVIDHGYGVFSGYSHLSQIHVTRGQSITRGQIIGVSGNTGRSGGAHLHWEVTVNGKWVDSVDFVNMWKPEA